MVDELACGWKIKELRLCLILSSCLFVCFYSPPPAPRGRGKGYPHSGSHHQWRECRGLRPGSPDVGWGGLCTEPSPMCNYAYRMVFGALGVGPRNAHVARWLGRSASTPRNAFVAWSWGHTASTPQQGLSPRNGPKLGLSLEPLTSLQNIV